MDFLSFDEKENISSRIPNFMKLGKFRKSVLTYLAVLMVLMIIGTFASYSFWESLLYTVYLILFWLVCMVIINWTFNPIIARSYLRSMGASIEEINTHRLRNFIPKIKLKNSINFVVVLAASFEIINTIRNHIDLTQRVNGRGSETYINADFQNTILILVATALITATILFLNRRK